MNPTSPSPERFDRSFARIRTIAGQAALFLLLWLSLMKFPSPPAADLDPSWRMVLGFAERHGLQYGTDLVFTYGPLGYLLPPTNSGGHYYHHIVWQLGANAAFAAGFFWIGAALRGWRKVLYYSFVLAFGSGYTDVVHMMAIMVFSLALTRDEIVRRRWLAGLFTVALAVLALVKFTNLLVACVAMACAVGLQVRRRRWLDVALLGGGFAGAFLAGWFAWKQHWNNLLPYLRNSLEASNGYAEGMGLYGPGSMLALGLAANLGIAVYLALTLYRAPDRPRSSAMALIAAAAVYLNWKHGFVRADGHVLASFFVCLFVVVSAPVLLQDRGPLQRTKGLLLTAVGVLCLVGIWRNAPTTVTVAPAVLNNRVNENLRQVLNLPNLTRLAREEFGSVSQLYQMPATRSIVGRGTIDVFGNEQGYALFNQLDYRPRPVFQGYFPYTERLARLNEAFMQSPRAPDYVLQKIQTLDYRLPSLDDSLATRYLYRHYTFLIEDHDFLLWRRNRPDPKLDTQTLLSEQTIGFADKVTTPATGDAPVWCEIDAQPSLLGRIRNFFYKPPFLQIAVAEDGGYTSTYRLISGMARAGFLLSPHFTSNHAIRRFEEGGPAPRIASFSVELEPGLRRYFQPGIRVRLYQLPPFPRSESSASVKSEVRYRVFSQVPSMVTSPFPPDILIENGREVLLAHPPSALEFELSPQNRHATGSFGLVQNAYTNMNTTDGAEFIIDWVDPQGKVRRVFYRHLRPLTVPEDRGFHTFDLVLPEGGGRLILQTTPGPDNNIAYDWTFWTDVKFAPLK